MRIVLLLALFMLTSIELRAQSSVTSLNIVLSEIQSVKVQDLHPNTSIISSEKKHPASGLRILNPLTSEIRKIEALYLSSGQVPGSSLMAKNSRTLKTPSAYSTVKNPSAIPHFIYQVNPR